jgi:hypothetical protein
MSNDTTSDTTPAGRHIDFESDEFESNDFDLITVAEPDRAYGSAWRERFATHHHLHNSIAS